MADEIVVTPVVETPAAVVETPAAQAAVTTSASASTPPAALTKAEVVAALKQKNAERAAAAAAETPPPAATPVATSETPAPAASKYDEDTIAMAQAYGVDVNGFADDASARNAVKLIAERYAFANQQVPQEEVEDEQVVDEIDKTVLDAKTAQYIKKLEAQSAKQQELLLAQHQAAQQAEAQYIDNLWADSTRRSIALVDGLAHPALGVSGKTTPLQDAGREAVFKTAGRLLNGFLREGRNPPAIEVVVRTALELNGIPSKKPATPNAKSLPPGPTAAQPAKKINLPTVRRPHDPLGIMQDESFRRAVPEIFAGRP